MTPCFVDTFFFLALLNPKDQAHQTARDVSLKLRRPLLTRTWIFTELADGIAGSSARSAFGPMIEKFRADRRVTVALTTDNLFQHAVNLYKSRPDKDWSLTDCISFVVMQQNGVTEALTGDHHFEQAGFIALLK
jgi:predicted nucleic acid-binding protein